MTKKNNKSFESSSLSAASVIAESFQIEGIIKTDVSIEINGKVEGEIISNSAILVGEKAAINANISCSEIVIAGTVNGNVTAKKRVIIKSKGKLIGEVKTKSFVIDDGGTFFGTSDMNMSSAATENVGNLNLSRGNNKDDGNNNKGDGNNNNDETNGETEKNDLNNSADNNIESDNDDGKGNVNGKKDKPWWKKI